MSSTCPDLVLNCCVRLFVLGVCIWRLQRGIARVLRCAHRNPRPFFALVNSQNQSNPLRENRIGAQDTMYGVSQTVARRPPAAGPRITYVGTCTIFIKKESARENRQQTKHLSGANTPVRSRASPPKALTEKQLLL